MKGFTSGMIHDFTLEKKIRRHNILWHPEPSFTVDKALYDRMRQYFHTVTFLLIEKDNTLTKYTTSATIFDQAKVVYNYGNGYNYRVPIKSFNKYGIQAKMGLK